MPRCAKSRTGPALRSPSRSTRPVWHTLSMELRTTRVVRASGMCQPARHRPKVQRHTLSLVTQTRTEKDSLGTLEVPADAYFGVQTARAIRNFPISGRRPDNALVRGAVQVKKAAARANRETGRLSQTLADAIIQAADEILDGEGPLADTLIDN